MGHLFTRMATVWMEQQTPNRLKPAINKRKRTDHDDIPNKRKIANNKLTKNDSDDDERLILSPRISPIISKFRRSFSSMTLFRCQLCRRCLKNKDNYMDHMIICAIERQASIKIVRAVKDKNESAVLQ